ncbi:Alkaline phosphatase synthesis sensor protein PhoR [Novipirellula aureliae]|uniref:histidine kinase n=1 Tax=Novipirellula aureliae TaxID=2527966 RepID=A0A5C6DAI0_9BACT|nr:HAMP domain-containing sensor histidine kinase [Novipirellula aureliae]TWU34163.1 Alkaline phosphatase synthesis sensor protein PhoR [Novipirellula aureliae]
MFERRSLTAPITLGVVMILLVVILTIVWVVGNWLSVQGERASPSVFMTILATGSVILAAMLAGVIAYLTLTVKAFNLNRRQSNFIDAVTHELKSPIASLKLYLQTLGRLTVDEQQQKDFHRFMLEDVERLDSLINHLLDAARIERNHQAEEKELIELDNLLGECSRSACLRHGVAEETVTLDCPAGLKMNSQGVQMEILFRNLIDNAIKYGGTPPEVMVKVNTLEKDQVVISVIDNGNGIPANQKRKVFGRFVRLGNELERSRTGTGLGLYLVRNVTRALGGSVRVLDRAEQPGTEFSVTLGGVESSSSREPSSHQ